VEFYPSKANDKLNAGGFGRLPFQPERVGRVMLNPHYPIRRLMPGTRAICDSGAFQDIDAGTRLLPWTALDRQLRFEEQLRWRTGDHNFHFEAVVIYDQMAGVDEALDEWGRKVKKRGTHDTAAVAVAETLRAARYYATQRERIRGRIAWVGQGVTPDQYVNDCVLPMRKLMRPGDWFAFGGFCIIGKNRSLLPVFCTTLPRVLDALISVGITRYHLLGVCVPDAVEFAAAEAARRGVAVSTDSSAVEFASLVNGAVYVNGRWTRGPWTKEQKGIDYNPVDLAHRNIVAYSEWAYSLGANEPTTCPCGAEWSVNDPDISLAVRAGVCPVCTAPTKEPTPCAA
jgi:hypothetical protein